MVSNLGKGRCEFRWNVLFFDLIGVYINKNPKEL